MALLSTKTKSNVKTPLLERTKAKSKDEKAISQKSKKRVGGNVSSERDRKK